MFFACASALHYYGGLRFEAAWLIGGAFALIAVWLYLLKQITVFKPYRLIIGINYAGLWEDLKLAPAAGPTYENFTFTAISAAIFARSDDRDYSTQLDLNKQIPLGAGTWTPGLSEISKGPTFFLRPMRAGFQFGIHVQEQWWKLHSDQPAPALRNLPLSYGNDIILGLLPVGYMPDHVRRWNEPISFWYSFDRKQLRWKKRLQDHGWTFDDNYPTRINHRYLRIGYSDI